MSPITKDSNTGTASRDTARSNATAGSSGDSAAKQQPVALEVPITVNGARAAEGSDKREPFSESTKTVMIFGSGAVIKLSSPLAPGQLLFLTNERTKKEVVCQVVKSKNYRSASGYVELEFTEPAVGFWGMRFPGDRIGGGPQAAPEAARPTSSSSSTMAAKPATPAPVSSKPATPTTPSSSVVPAPLDSASLLGSSKSKAAGSSVPVVPTPAGSDAPLVAPWLKKREPAAKAPVPPASTASREAAAKSEEVESSLPPTRNFDLSQTSDKAASIFAPSEAPANLANVGLSSLAPFFDVKPGTVEAPPPPPTATAPVASDAETEELKQHTARLQEELSRMHFAEEASSTPAKPAVETTPAAASEPSVALLRVDPVHENPVRLVENSSACNAGPLLPELPEHEEPAKVAPAAPLIPALESLEQEELKIPAWLGPLARNATAPSSPQEFVSREKAKRAAEQPRLEEVTAPLEAPAVKQKIAKSRAPQFGTARPSERIKSAAKQPSKKSGKGMLLGAVAAGVLLLAGGGWWYMNQQSAGVQASIPAAQEANVLTTPQDSVANSPKEATAGPALSTQKDMASSQAKPEAADSNAPSSSTTGLLTAAPSNASAAAARNAQPAADSPNNSMNTSPNKGSAATTASSAQPEPAPEEIKKPVLGEVHLAKPKVSQKRAAQPGAAPDAEILSEDQPDANADSQEPGLGIANNQPAAPEAPAAAGGEVKPAKLISDVPPAYPALAKAQHVSGGVTIDALIEATGRVTKMKVLSGPVLLQQAAMDALKQWKYQPATLDGKAVPMHVTVTIQFRLQ